MNYTKNERGEQQKKYLLKPMSLFMRQSILDELVTLHDQALHLDQRMKAMKEGLTEYGKSLIWSITNDSKIKEFSTALGDERSATLVQIQEEVRTDKSVRSPGEGDKRTDKSVRSPEKEEA